MVVHALALAALLIALAAVVGTGTSFSEDEGAAVVQARQLADHHSWIVRRPLPTIDDTVALYPYRLPDVGTKGAAPFAKHPLYALVLAGLWRLGGINGLIGLSIAGTVFASVAGWYLARLLDPSLARPAFWVLGIGSPLLFDGFLVQAHALGAAVAGGLALLLFGEHRRPWLSALGAAVAAALLVGLRTEGLLFVGAAGVVALVVRRSRWSGAATLVGGALAFAGNRAWTRHILGAPRSGATYGVGDATERTGLSGRLEGALTTLFHPSYSAGRAANALLFTALVAVAVGAVLWRRRSPLAGVVVGVAALAVLLRVAIGPTQVVPGLFVACPIVWAGLWFGTLQPRGATWRSLLFVVAAFAGAVVATQYSQGGGVEWGGRYFALSLPLAIPITVAALRAGPRPLLVGLSVASLGLGVLAMGALHTAHQRTERLLGAIAPRADIVVTTAGLLPRLDWPHYEQRRWVLIAPDKLDALLRQLPSAGVHRVALVFPDVLPPDGWAGRGTPVPGLRWRVAEVRV